tara:strand:- start:10809 stop:11759 length:951 start_codon:yes stop_codon:yes gene_type:complete
MAVVGKADGPILQVWQMGDEILVQLMDSRIQRTTGKMSFWRSPEKPYPINVNHAVKCSDQAIMTWIDDEIRVSLMASMDFSSSHWESTYENRTELKEQLKHNGIIRHKCQYWFHSLDAEVLSIASHEDKFAFVSMNRGVYYLKSTEGEPEEIWRSNIPDWPKPWPNVVWKRPGEENGNLDTYTQSIHLDEDNLILFDERGSWVSLSTQDGKEISTGRLPFNGKNTGTWRGENSWAILEDHRKLHILDSQFNIINSHKTPGPVNYARESSKGWIWTGWRHDGCESGIKKTNEIGLWIDSNESPRVLSNDGIWRLFFN